MLPTTKAQTRSGAIRTILGYGKGPPDVGPWQLLIKEEFLRLNQDGEEEEITDNVEYYPLLKASRKVRMKAAAQFDNLIAALIRRAKEMLKNVSSAEKLAIPDQTFNTRFCLSRGHDTA